MKPFLIALRLQQSGRVGEAIPFYHRAIRANNAVPEVHNNLGCALLELRRFDEAAAVLQRALELRPNFAVALDNLGIVYTHLEQHAKAIAVHEQAVALAPDHAPFWVRLGTALATTGRYMNALDCFEEAIRLAPDSAAAHNGRGVVLERLERQEEATAEFRTALELAPNLGEAACNLGANLLHAGDISDALTLFGHALELDPRSPRAHLYLALGRRGCVEDSRLSQLEDLHRDLEAISPIRKIELHFALAAVYERRKRYDEAFAQLIAGNALKRERTTYDESAMLRTASSLEAAYTQPFMEAMSGSGNPSSRPIFVFGMPRSGTTLVEQLLAAHSAVTGAGELSLIERLACELSPLLARGPADPELPEGIRAFGERYLSATDPLARNAYLVDKMPANFWHAALIHLAFPNARMIHVRRDPLDTCFSCFATLFADGALPFAYDLAELGHWYRAYDRIMEKWRVLLPDDRFIEVDYERLVTDFENEARRLIAFCGLPWEARTLTFHEVHRTVRTASNVQVRQPLYQTSVGRSRPFVAHLGVVVGALAGSDGLASMGAPTPGGSQHVLVRSRTS